MRYLLFMVLILVCCSGFYYYSVQEKKLSPSLVQAEINRLHEECKELEQSLEHAQIYLTVTQEEIRQTETTFASQYRTIKTSIRKEEELNKSKTKVRSQTVQNELNRLRAQRRCIEEALKKKQIQFEETLQNLETRMSDRSAKIDHIISRDWQLLENLKKEHRIFRGRQSGTVPSVVAQARNNMNKKHRALKQEDYKNRLSQELQIKEGELKYAQERKELITLLRKIDHRSDAVKNSRQNHSRTIVSINLLEQLEEEYKMERNILTGILHSAQIECSRISDELESKRFEAGTILSKRMEENRIRLSDIKKASLTICGIIAALTLFAFFKSSRRISSFS